MKTIKLINIICGILLSLAVLSSWGAYASDRASNDAKQTFSNEELAQMLAPIALYPDPLLSQVLMAATYPFEVVEAERWVTKNPYLKKEALDEALQAKDWDVSVLALCHYPKVLTMLSENLSWTARVGDAFSNQEEDVMDTIQELRARAREAGNLSTSREQRVIVEDRYIRIEPVGSDYIYIPAYDPLVVYGRWWLPMYPPFLILLPGLVVSGGGVIFSPPFYMEYGVFGWSMFNWGIRQVVIVDIDRTRRFYRHHQERRWPDRHHWRPDVDRRHIRQQRAGDIPRFVPPVRSKPDMRYPDRRPAPGVRTPDKGGIPDRGIESDKRPRWNKPDAEKGKGTDMTGPRVVDKDKTEGRDRRVINKDKPAEKPRITDRDKMKVPEQGMGKPPVIRDRGGQESVEKPRVSDKDKGKIAEQGMNKPPVIRDRGKEENADLRKQTPVTGPKSTREEQNVQRSRDRDNREPVRTESRQDKGDQQERSRERWDDRQDQKDRGGMGRDRGERK